MPTDEHETKRDAMTDERTTPNGESIDTSLLRSFLSAALAHHATIDPVNDLVHKSVAGRWHPSVVAGNLKPIVADLLETATQEDWQAIADELIATHPANQESNPEGSTAS